MKDYEFGVGSHKKKTSFKKEKSPKFNYLNERIILRKIDFYFVKAMAIGWTKKFCTTIFTINLCNAIL